MVKGLNHLISAMSTYLLKTARILNEPLVAKSTNYSCPFSILTPHSLLHFNFFLKIVGLGCYQFVFLYSAFISYSNSAYRFFLKSPLETLSSSGIYGFGSDQSDQCVAFEKLFEDKNDWPKWLSRLTWNRHISYSICDVSSWMGGCYLNRSGPGLEATPCQRCDSKLHFPAIPDIFGNANWDRLALLLLLPGFYLEIDWKWHLELVNHFDPVVCNQIISTDLQLLDLSASFNQLLNLLLQDNVDYSVEFAALVLLRRQINVKMENSRNDGPSHKNHYLDHSEI